jgi:hypothetical protein
MALVGAGAIASALIACYGGEVLPPPDDDVPFDASIAKDASVDAGTDAVVTEGGSSGTDAGGAKYVFVTKQTFAGDFGGIIPASNVCKMASAVSSKLAGRSFTAWVSDSTANVAALFDPTDGPYVRLDGVVVAKSFAALAGGALDAPIDVDETGAKTASLYVWTGSKADGTATAIDCNGWAQQSGELGTAGSTQASDEGWSRSVELTCVTLAPLYCVEN